MESVLKTIAKQANLERVLFTPALKKIYFDMAVASGGATQFKHIESIRKGVDYARDKVDDKKRVLIFCTASELIHSYDQMLAIAQTLKPVVILALRSGLQEDIAINWNVTHLGPTGWLQFHTHTQQEAYDHLVLAYSLIEEKKVSIPILVLHSALSHKGVGELTPDKNLQIGDPLKGLQSSRSGKPKDFAEAIAAMKKKKEKANLLQMYQNLQELFGELYKNFGTYTIEDGVPFICPSEEDQKAVISLIPCEESQEFYRLFCYRPFNVGPLTKKLRSKDVIGVVEPKPSPGVTIPPFYGEILGSMMDTYEGRIVSITVPSSLAYLNNELVESIKRIFDQKSDNINTFIHLG